ncbi:D-alanyl-D-alanine carboxypeptidase family protein [Acrocarpospora catenulata]|uniref:D-alanyl-D-alanine carboxypeptidase family protein n=1 Tax=Acrocarpospora catenulata TaxID=2836182 RepID=UPI001BDA865B|nr:D-alanyl-D-alanine carboxypeptidase family protein [Acrocarpospora catenulata]
MAATAALADVEDQADSADAVDSSDAAVAGVVVGAELTLEGGLARAEVEVSAEVALGADRTEAAGRRDPGTLTELRREAEQATKGIEQATKALVARQKEFDSSVRQLEGKLTELRDADTELALVRRPLSDLVEYMYQNPSSGGLGPVLFGGEGANALRTMSDVNQLATGRNRVVHDAGKLFEEREKLAAESQELRATKLLQEAQLSFEIDTLRKRSQQTVKALTAALAKLGVKRGGRSCDPTRVVEADQYANGLLPKSMLCPLPFKGEELRADAAIAFADLNLAYKKRFGQPLCVVDSYRSLRDQQIVYYQRPGLAAIPGRSNHGLGLAVDFCGPIRVYKSTEFVWLEQNGKQFGWIHPDWAYVSPFEPWHWEYDPKVGSLL